MNYESALHDDASRRFNDHIACRKALPYNGGFLLAAPYLLVAPPVKVRLDLYY